MLLVRISTPSQSIALRRKAASLFAHGGLFLHGALAHPGSLCKRGHLLTIARRADEACDSAATAVSRCLRWLLVPLLSSTPHRRERFCAPSPEQRCNRAWAAQASFPVATVP
ncbi:hypothetical protein PSPO01_02965 [Paraphaeosphaeria sporulosa]